MSLSVVLCVLIHVLWYWGHEIDPDNRRDMCLIERKDPREESCAGHQLHFLFASTLKTNRNIKAVSCFLSQSALLL